MWSPAISAQLASQFAAGISFLFLPGFRFACQHHTCPILLWFHKCEHQSSDLYSKCFIHKDMKAVYPPWSSLSPPSFLSILLCLFLFLPFPVLCLPYSALWKEVTVYTSHGMRGSFTSSNYITYTALTHFFLMWIVVICSYQSDIHLVLWSVIQHCFTCLFKLYLLLAWPHK